MVQQRQESLDIGEGLFLAFDLFNSPAAKVLLLTGLYPIIDLVLRRIVLSDLGFL